MVHFIKQTYFWGVQRNDVLFRNTDMMSVFKDVKKPPEPVLLFLVSPILTAAGS